MSDQTSIFDNTNSGVPAPNTDSVSNVVNATNDSELTNLLSGIKNERGEQKYKTLKDAIVGLQNAQEYIPDLKQTLLNKDIEIERLRAEAKKVSDLEESVRKLTERGSDFVTPTKNAISEQDIAELVNRSLDNTLSQRDAVATQKQNIKAVVDALQSTFGADAEKKFYDKATELGMTVAEFNALAAKSPKMVLSTLGVQNKQPTQPFTPTQGSVNTQGFTPPTDSFVGRNKTPSLIGATTQDLRDESRKANQMVDELHKAGKSVYELTDPKVYFKHFGKQ
ncbi:MAG: hypothetical protein WA058_01025 [Minisyncoccia bacterium]